MRFIAFSSFVILMTLNCSVNAQCDEVSIDVINKSEPYEACRNESLILTNTSNDLSSQYVWDFCTGDLGFVPTANTSHAVTAINRPSSIETLFHNNSYYVFYTSRDNNSLVMADHGDDLNNVPNVINYGNISGLLSRPEAIKVTQENGQWYGLLYNGASDNTNLLRISFGSDFLMTPTAEVIGSNIGGIVGAMDFGYSNDSLVAIISSYSKNITAVNFGNSILNTPIVQDIQNTIINEANNINDMHLIKECDQWYAFAVSFTSKNLLRLDFGTSLFSTPIPNVLATDVFDSDNPLSIRAAKDGGQFYLFIVSSGNNLYKITLGDNIENGILTSENIGKLGILDRVRDIDVIKKDSQWEAVLINTFNRDVYNLTWPLSCDIDGQVINNTLSLNFSDAGVYIIDLERLDNYGQPGGSSSVNIGVTTDTAPSISFSNQTICQSSPIIFNSESDGSGLTYNWDFGDSGSSMDADPSYTYLAPGEYEVMLSIDDGTCGNFTKQTVTIYPEPVPDFTIPSGVICTNQQVIFENVTPGDFDGNITWQWQVDGVDQSTDQDLNFEFLSGGNKEVKLIAAIPGCEVEFAQNITNVREGAIPDFSFNDSCQGELVQFNNNSVGDITNFDWDFGNGFTSTVENPTLEFPQDGDFLVTLSLTNSDGCITTLQRPITIRQLPNVQFSNELSCEDIGTQFNDLTTISLDNIASWEWDFGDGSTSIEQNPEHTFTSAGNFEVKLKATTTFGCIDSLNQVVSVQSAPNANFEFDKRCVGVPIAFTDTSLPVNGENLTSWAWNIGGAFTDEQNPEFTFDTSLDYTVSLTVTSENLCTSTISQIVSIPQEAELEIFADQNCDNQLTQFSSNIQIDDDQVTQSRWFIDSELLNSGESTDADLNAGNYNVRFGIETQNGCFYEVENVFSVFNSPNASFETTPTFGAPPLEVTFLNTSQGAVSYFWDFKDDSSSQDQDPSHIFNDLGEYDVSLVATSLDNCKDTINQRVSVVIPELDLELLNLSLIPSLIGEKISLTIRNTGTVVVNSIFVNIDLGGELTINEVIEVALSPNQVTTEQLDFELNNRRLDYLCVNITSNFDDLEIDISNNVSCLNFNNSLTVFGSPYPNPVVNGTMQLEVISQIEGNANFIFTDSHGKLIKEAVRNVISGPNQLEFDLNGLKEGLYLLQIRFADQNQVYRIALVN